MYSALSKHSSSESRQYSVDVYYSFGKSKLFTVISQHSSSKS